MSTSDWPDEDELRDTGTGEESDRGWLGGGGPARTIEGEGDAQEELDEHGENLDRPEGALSPDADDAA